MKVVLLLLECYALIGEELHEWLGIAKKLVKKSSAVLRWVLRGLALLIAGYGIYAFVKRGIGGYMLLMNEFVFFDFEEPLVFFLANYIAVMGLFVFIGHYLSVLVRAKKTTV